MCIISSQLLFCFPGTSWDYCVFGLCLSSGTIKKIKDHFSETESVSILR
jgi:hypothetical protein